MAIDSIPMRLMKQAEERPGAPAYAFVQDGEWQTIDYATFADEVRTAGKALIHLGIDAGDVVCILSFNRPEWTLIDVAAMAVGGVAAGIYTTSSPTEVQYIIAHSEATVVVVEDQDQWLKVNAQRHNLPLLKYVVMCRGAETIYDPLVMSWQEFMAGGDADDGVLDDRLDALEDDQVATLIYTSGTTGPPKGVMLSHKNLAWTATMAGEVAQLRSSDWSLSYLPLCHIAEQMFTIHAPITVGYRVHYAESFDRLKDNLLAVQPSVFFGVPRVYEKFYAAVGAKLAAASGIKASLAQWSHGVGRQVSELRNRGESPDAMLGLQFAIANRLVFRKLKAAMGLKNARVLVTGAAPIQPEIQEFFAGFDLIIREVYGQSEDCGPTSFNVPGRTRFGTVGPVFPGVEVVIADDDEIVVKGPNVFLGYYKEPEATDDTLRDGWLHSGDLGAFDSDGFLVITGRKKDIIITAGGKNIAPNNIEVALKGIGLVNQAVLIGDRRKYLSALLTLDPDAVEAFGRTHGLSGPFHESEAVRQHIQEGIEQVNAEFARVEHVRQFVILPRDFTIDDGELTPTLKIKRHAVYANWADAIESMYEG